MLKSHPDRLLVDHLREVSEKAHQLLEGKMISFSLPGIDTEIIREVMRISAVFYDIGKGTVFFLYLLAN